MYAVLFKGEIVKLLYCPHCGDIVRLFPEKRFCRCGKSWGQYLEDKSTTVQTYPGLSLGISNPDFKDALDAFVENPKHFSPILAMRCWVNPASEPDVTFVAIEEDEAETTEEPQQGEETLAEVLSASEPAEEPGGDTGV